MLRRRSHRRGHRQVRGGRLVVAEPAESQAQPEMCVVIGGILLHEALEHPRRVGVLPVVELRPRERLSDGLRGGFGLVGVRKELGGSGRVASRQQVETAAVPVVDLPGGLSRTVARHLALPTLRLPPGGRAHSCPAIRGPVLSSMPRVTEAAAATRPLVLSPFRGLRYSPAQVADLASVTSPPYDVLDREAIAALQAGQPYNIVRIILPRSAQPERHEPDPYQQAGRLLAEWRAKGVLVADSEPALYVYEQRVTRANPPDDFEAASAAGMRPASYVLRGLLGALELREPTERVILPHENVLPHLVADRLALMRACAANLEPILLAYDGGGVASDLVEEATAPAPLLHARTSDGAEHRVWRIADPGALRMIAADLAPRQALIADGHHRYATYLRLQQERRDAGAEAGPWDSGLALLVDQRAHPLELTAIHRSVSGLTHADVVKGLAASPFEVKPYGRDSSSAHRALRACLGEMHGFLFTDGDDWTLVRIPGGASELTDEVPLTPGRGLLDTEILHGLLFRLLAVTDDQLGYEHDELIALRAARDRAGLAVILNPVELETVQAVARDGGRMPRKSTSFGPKPRTGFVMRAFADH